jgi:hypothetical protein
VRKPASVDDLASRLTQAANAPLVPAIPAQASAAAPKPSKKGNSVSVFLRLPADLHAELEAEAMNRTKATGRGVTVQQVIVGKLGRSA